MHDQTGCTINARSNRVYDEFTINQGVRSMDDKSGCTINGRSNSVYNQCTIKQGVRSTHDQNKVYDQCTIKQGVRSMHDKTRCAISARANRKYNQCTSKQGVRSIDEQTWRTINARAEVYYQNTSRTHPLTPPTHSVLCSSLPLPSPPWISVPRRSRVE